MKSSTLLGVIVLGTIGLGLFATAVASFADLGGSSPESQVNVLSSKSSSEASTTKNNDSQNKNSKTDSEEVSSSEEKESSSSLASNSSEVDSSNKESTSSLDSSSSEKNAPTKEESSSSIADVSNGNTDLEDSTSSGNNLNNAVSEQNPGTQAEQEATIETPAVNPPAADANNSENKVMDEVTYVTDVFPQTGEQKSQLPLIMGIILVILVILFLVFMRKKNKDEQNKKIKLQFRSCFFLNK